VGKRLISLLLAGLAGVAFWAAFPDVGLWPLGLVGVGLLWGAFSLVDRPGWNALLGFTVGLVFFGPHVWWAAIATAIVPWVALVLLQAVFWAALGILWTWTARFAWVKNGPWWQALTFAALFTGVEQWRSAVPFGGFPWGRLAWSVAYATPGRIAWLGGSVLVTFVLTLAANLVAITAVAVYRARRWPSQIAAQTSSDGELANEVLDQQTLRRPQVTAVNGMPLIAALLLLILPRWLPLPQTPAAPPVQLPTDNRGQWVDAGIWTNEAGVLQVGLAQGNVVDPGLPGPENADAVFRSHLDATQLLADDVQSRQLSSTSPPLVDHFGQVAGPWYDIVIWPENSAAWDPARWPQIADALDFYADVVGAPIMIGSMEYPESGGRYNVMLLWEDGVGTTARYAKRRPAPFGEYIPLRSFARMITDQVDRLPIDMLAADNPPIMAWYSPRLGRSVILGVGICFEVAYDEIFINAVRQGAEVIIVPTNNASFGVTAQSTQQLQMTAMQAITTGRAAVQISTVGVSGVFTPDGRLVAVTNLWEQDWISALLPLRTTITPAVRMGELPGLLFQVLAIALPLAALGVSMARRRQIPLTTDQTLALSAMAVSQ